MPMVYRDGDRYYCREVVEYNGEKKRIYASSSRGRADARKLFNQKLNEWQDEIDRKIEIITGQEKLSIAMQKWYELYQLPLEKTPSTLSVDKDTMKQLSRTPLGDMIITDITADDIQKNLNKLAIDHSDSIIKKRYLMLKMFFKYFSVTRQCFNIMEAVKLPKSKKVKPIVSKDTLSTEKTAYTDKEIKILYNYFLIPFNRKEIGKPGCGTIYGRFFITTLFLYLRYGEAAELRVKDVDFKKNVVHVRRQWCTRSQTVRLPKYNSVRDVPIAKEIRGILLEACVGKRGNDLIFPSGELNKDRQYLPSSKDGHIRESVAIESLHRALNHLGLPRHSLHDLRHDGISLFVRKGVKAEDISRFAGHKSVSFTMDRYYRHTKEISEETMSLIVGDKYIDKKATASIKHIGQE